MIGPTESFEEMFGALSRQLGAMLKRIGTNVHDAEDAVQETLLRWLEWEHTGRAHLVVNRHCWLRKVAIRATWKSCGQRLPSNLDAALTCAVSFTDEVERRDEANIVHSALAMLPERERELVVFCDMEGGSLREAKEEFEISLHEVRSTLKQGRARLHQHLLARGLGRVIA